MVNFDDPSNDCLVIQLSQNLSRATTIVRTTRHQKLFSDEIFRQPQLQRMDTPPGSLGPTLPADGRLFEKCDPGASTRRPTHRRCLSLAAAWLILQSPDFITRVAYCRSTNLYTWFSNPTPILSSFVLFSLQRHIF